MPNFYDLETSGLDTSSQIFQVAVIFTDSDMNTLSSKNLKSRRSPWVLPSPGSILVTGMTTEELKKEPLTNYEMMRELDTWLRRQHWPVDFWGFNNFGFDERNLASNLRQNLLSPDLTTAKNEQNGMVNGRGDVSEAVKTVIAYMPGALTLETLNDQGYPSLSLINVATQNGVKLGEDEAHDGFNDTRATRDLAKVLSQVAPQVWQHLSSMTTPAGVDAFLDANPVFTQANLVRGKAQGKVYAALSTEEGMPNAQVIFNLAFDPANFKDLSVENLADIMQTRNWPDKNVNPFRFIRKDKMPTIMPLSMSDPVLPADYNEELYAARAAALKTDKEFLDKVSKAAALMNLRKYGPHEVLPPETKEKLSTWVQGFHNAADWKERAALVRDFDRQFHEERKTSGLVNMTVKYAGRLVYEHAPEELTPAQRDGMKRWIADRLLNPDPEVNYMTITRARNELEKIQQERAEGKGKWAKVTDSDIRSLKLYYTSIEKDLLPYYTPYTPVAPAATPVNDDKAPSASPAPDTRKTGNGPGFQPK